MKVIVHGGAGSRPDEPKRRQAVLDEAASAGADEATAVDAVEAALRVLEANPRFNAGTGGAVQSDGIVRTDAGVMTSDSTGDDRRESPNERAGSEATREAGAAASMPGVEAAVSVARAVMEQTPHVMLAGVHAVDFADAVGVETERDLWSGDTRERWDDLDDTPSGGPREHLDWIRGKFGATNLGGEDERSESSERTSGEAAGRGDEADQAGDGTDGNAKDHDTVGAVAYDGETFAAATSTGGRWLALAGRVGDVPQIGSGFYASPAGAASATGAGEAIAKTTLTRRAVRHLEEGLDAQEAAERAVEELGDLTGEGAGVIVLDADGEYGEAFNTDGMQTARA